MSDILLRERDGGTVVLTMNRPEKLNALNEALVRALHDAVVELDADMSIRVVVLTGAGEKSFVAGADIAGMSEMSTTAAKAFADLGHAVGERLERAHFPVIAAVNGFALGGGCELALACDFVYASEKAKFGQPEVNLGIIPGFGGTQRLARRVGIGRARELVYTGDTLDANEALRIGLVNAVVPAGELLAKVRDVAKKIEGKAPLAIAQAKRLVYRGEDVPLVVANELEAQAFSALFGSLDQREGMKAFVEKRKATFTGA